jgi:hypothetical protein
MSENDFLNLISQSDPGGVADVDPIRYPFGFSELHGTQEILSAIQG